MITIFCIASVLKKSAIIVITYHLIASLWCLNAMHLL